MSHSSIEEKAGVSKLETIDTGDYDPDAGLSDEERAKIVNCLLVPIILVKTYRLISCTGQSPRPTTGFQTHSMGQCPLYLVTIRTVADLNQQLSFLSLISVLDRTNIGNAKVDGLPKDLHLTPGQYNATLSIFFVSYSVFEPLTNVLLKKWRPSVFLPIIM
jgi:hypothetical protein